MKKLDRPALEEPELFRHGGTGPADPAEWVDFSTNINPLGPPPSVRRAVSSALSSITRYPDPNCRTLLQALAAFHKIDRAHLVVGNGSNDLIYAVARALKARRVAIVEPTYTEYFRAAQRAGALVEHWLPAEPALEPEPFNPGTAEMVWLGHPNNPTGIPWRRDVLADWIAAYPHTCFVVDEAFLPFLADENNLTLIACLARLPNLIVLQSLTKIYSLPGLRLGYLAASPTMAERVRAEIVPWSVNTLAQAAGVAALTDRQFLADTRSWLSEERAWLLPALTSLSAVERVWPGRANFLLLRLREPRAPRLAHSLSRYCIRVRVASNFVGLHDAYLRLAIRSAPENQRLFSALSEVLEEKTPRWPSRS